MNAIRISTRNYENSNAGRKPRPSQSGFWMFEAVRADGSTHQFTAHGTYTDAIRQVKAKAKFGNFEKLVVMP